MLVLLLIAEHANAYTLCGSLSLSASIPAFTLDTVPTGIVFAAAEMREVPCDEGGGTVDIRLRAAATEHTLLHDEVDYSGPAGLAQATPDPPLEVGKRYRFDFGGEFREFAATEDVVPVPEGAPSLDSLTAAATETDAVTLTAALTAADYPAGLSLLGLESTDGRLLALTDNPDFGATDLTPSDGCYVPIQVFADGSTARGTQFCPEVSPFAGVAGCSTGGSSVAAAMTMLAGVLGVWRRGRGWASQA